MEENKKFNFSCSVPGKIIITGEHAVVYGSKAVVASINLRTICQLILNKNTEKKMILILGGRNIDIDLISLKEMGLSQKIISCSERIKETYDKSEGDISCIKIYDLFDLLVNLNVSKDDLFVTSIFLFIIHSLFKDSSLYKIISFLNESTIQLCVESQIPSGAGLGSSAAFTTSIVSCFIVNWNLI